MEHNTSGEAPKPELTGFQKHKEDLIEFLKFAIVTLAIVIPIRMFVAQPFVVSGDSMIPTFHDGEYLIIDELSYHLRDPHRHDVIVFKYPKDPSKYFIKRIIGLPHETVVIKNGTVTVQNAEHPEGMELTEPYINELFQTNGTYQLKENEYFVMGDNRNRSSDSRAWGTLSEEYIIGRAYLRLLPVANAAYLPGSYK